MARRRRKKLPTEPVEATINGLSHEGRGIALVDGKTTFIEGALEGEVVSFVYTWQKAKFDEGKTIEVLQASEKRVEPPCEFSTICGGCSLQHMHVDAQINFKEKALKDLFTHVGKVSPETWLPPLRGEHLGYRLKARVGVKFVDKKGGTLVGFREKRSGFLADIKSCQVLVSQFGLALMEVRALIDGLEAKREIPQIEIAAGDEETALIFRHLSPLSEQDRQAIITFCQSKNFHCYFQSGGPDTVTKMWPEDDVYRLHYAMPELDVKYAFHPNDFTQVNASINQKMVPLALSMLGLTGEEKVLDLFCGLGNFTLPLAKQAKHVVGVEGSEEMVKRGYENAELNGLSNIEFHARDLFKPFEDASWFGEYDCLLIDPPRSGAELISEQIAKFNAKKIVYVSCGPATLARDAGLIVAQGYRLVKAGVMDMFPHTAHVESIALFERE